MFTAAALVLGAVGGYVLGCRYPVSFLRKAAAAEIAKVADKVESAISPKA
jgi:hypothetical protein